MNNNVSNYQEYTFPKLLKQYGKVLVPMIQRDYAQGRKNKKETDVRNNLLNDIFSNREVHFDLIFGSKETRIIDGNENTCFIPVDGQQRLTTLFLLYLYSQKQLHLNLDLNLSQFSYDTRRAALDFCKSITSNDWQSEDKVSCVIKDSSWFMDYWENDPTVEGMLNMLDDIDKKYKDCGFFPNLDKITFYFFDLESNGLNENLYLKMNSRGKPLTSFENLKAKIEKILPEISEFDNNCFPDDHASPTGFREKWKFFMDRNWTEAFWDKSNPGKYDEYLARFIVRFLSGYWAAFGKDDKKQTEILQTINNKNEYADFIPFEPIMKALNLTAAFPRLAFALTLLQDISKIKPYWSKGKDELNVGEKSEYKLISVVLSYVLFNGDAHAIHFAWNMAENTIIGYDTFVAYCKRIGVIYNHYYSTVNTDFYNTITSIDFDQPSDQLKEEIVKANKIINGDLRTDQKTWEEVLSNAEQYAFFKGSIRFLFTDEHGYENWEDFDLKWENAQLYYDENGVRDYDDYKYRSGSMLMKSLIANCDNFWGKIYWWFEFSNNSIQWKRILVSRNWLKPVNIVLKGNLDLITAHDKNILNIIDDGLLDFICNNMPNARIRKTYYDYQAMWQSRNLSCQVVLNPILAQLKYDTTIEYSNENRIENCRYYKCVNKNVNFQYKGLCFQWWGDKQPHELDIYLMKSDWKDYLKRGEPTYDKKTDEDKYYCFNVSHEMSKDTTLFTKELERIAKEAVENCDLIFKTEQ